MSEQAASQFVRKLLERRFSGAGTRNEIIRERNVVTITHTHGPLMPFKLGEDDVAKKEARTVAEMFGVRAKPRFDYATVGKTKLIIKFE